MKEYNVLQYGAVGDGATNDAFAIQHAIDDCAKNGGGRVVLQSGYVLGAGIAELIARVAICAFLPPLFAGGALGCDAPAIAFVALCAGDPGAWLAGSLVLLVPFFRTILCGEGKKTKCRAK